MTNDMRALIRFVCDGDIRRAQAQTQIILKNNKTQKDAAFTTSMLKSLEDSQNRFIQLPANLQGIISAEDSSFFQNLGICFAKPKRIWSNTFCRFGKRQIG